MNPLLRFRIQRSILPLAMAAWSISTVVREGSSGETWRVVCAGIAALVFVGLAAAVLLHSRPPEERA